MTNWQKECLIALMTSPTAWQIFKAKQKNHKMLNQYISRIFPYKTHQTSKEAARVLSTVDYNITHIYKKPHRKIRQDLNIGIEIEFDGTETPDYIKKKILNSGCISFDSGYDADYTGRLRENRIRLNGIYGLKGLWILLEYMRENDKLAKNSSIHIHIDRRNHKKTAVPVYFMTSDSKTQKIQDLLLRIFNIPNKHGNSYQNLINLNSATRRSIQYETLEFRFCHPTFNYSFLVLQIITCIHLSETLGCNKEPNLQFLENILSAYNYINIKDKCLVNMNHFTRYNPIHSAVVEWAARRS